jgi:hypothetical protein
MGSWWSVDVGGQAAPVWGKNHVPDELMLLFTDEDRYLDPAKLRAFAEDENQTADTPAPVGPPLPWQIGLMVYSAPAGVLRKRLDLQGFSSNWVRQLSTAFFDDSEDERQPPTLWQEGAAMYPNGAAITAALTTRSGRAAGWGSHLDPREHPEACFLNSRWEELRGAFDDPRFALALSLCRTRASTEVKLDLTDLVMGGWITTNEHPHRAARLRMSAAVAADGDIIVVTEGSSDARRLHRSLEIAAPEVAHLFTFLDIDLRSPGGTDRVVSLTKGMAAAGVMNRIIAVLDNDTAGREAAAQLSKLNLPGQIVIVCLPKVPYGTRYPTLGPSGPGTEDVNGRAVSMEFMFGEDVLRNAEGELYPVRWHAFNEKVGDYQGRLDSADKARTGKRIDAALSAETSDGMHVQVRTGCTRLANALIDAASPSHRIPASEGSDLTEMWRHDPFSAIRITP